MFVDPMKLHGDVELHDEVVMPASRYVEHWKDHVHGVAQAASGDRYAAVFRCRSGLDTLCGFSYHC